MHTQDRCLRNVNTSQVIPFSVRWSPEVLIVEKEPPGDGGILLIIDGHERYSRYGKCFSAEQLARLPENWSLDHQFPLQDPKAKIPIGNIHKTTWEEDEGLRKYLLENIPTGKVR